MGEAVRETIDRSEALIAALLMLARSESVVRRAEPVDLSALAADCVTDLHARAESTQVEIHPDLQPAVARGEPRLLERMIANLIDNGIRYNEPGGHLRVATATTGDSAQLSVSNTGPVIDPEQAQLLTEPFRRLSRVSGGFGLGLSIVRSVAEAHGGTVELSAPPDGGLVVRVTLPADVSSIGSTRRQRSLTKS
jgi:signal transduction histidine kinase